MSVIKNAHNEGNMKPTLLKYLKIWDSQYLFEFPSFYLIYHLSMEQVRFLYL